MSEVTLNPLECALDEAQALRRQVDALQAENAKLKTDVKRMFQANVEKNNEVLKLLGDNAKLQNDADLLRAMLSQERTEKRCHMAENAKLRELALDSYDAIDSVFWDGETETKERFKPRMRELGVEVDGGTMACLRSDRTAQRVIVADGDTDCATGHCECGGCGGAIDCWDRFCKHCGAKLED